MRRDATGSLLPRSARILSYGRAVTQEQGERRARVAELIDRDPWRGRDLVDGGRVFELAGSQPKMAERAGKGSIVRLRRDEDGWRVDDVLWSGVLLSDVLAAAGASTTSSALRFFSFDGAYTESLTMEQALRDDVLVATSMFGEPVTREHGGPVRLYVAPMYGYKSLKWMSGIEVVDDVVPGYWEVRGYDIDAWVGASNGRNDEPIA